jgi:hypothetical protein
MRKQLGMSKGEMKTPRKQTHTQICANGGKAGTGKAKARTTEQARAAANTRWDRVRANNLRQAILNSCGATKGGK